MHCLDSHVTISTEIIFFARAPTLLAFCKKMIPGLQSALRNGAIGFMLKGAVSFVLNHVYTFLRRRMISIWVFGHTVPKEPSMWKEHPELFLENSGTASLRSYFTTRPPGATVFWAIEGAGKTFALSRVSAEFQGPRHRFIYVDCAGSAQNDADSVKRTLYQKLGMDPHARLFRDCVSKHPYADHSAS